MWKVYNIPSWAVWGKTGLISSDWDKKNSTENQTSQDQSWSRVQPIFLFLTVVAIDRLAAIMSSSKNNDTQLMINRGKKNQRDLLTRKLIFSTFVLDIFSHHEVELLLLLLWSVSWKFARGSIYDLATPVSWCVSALIRTSLQVSTNSKIAKYLFSPVLKYHVIIISCLP